MNLVDIAKLVTYLPALYDIVSRLIASAKSNEDVVAKVATLTPEVAEFIKWLGATLFPGSNTELQQAAAALVLFGKEFVKGAQQTLNIVSPLLGLAPPNLVVDGMAGPKTQAATKAVQAALAEKGWKDLLVDGIFGFKTRDAINAFFATVAK